MVRVSDETAPWSQEELERLLRAVVPAVVVERFRRRTGGRRRELKKQRRKAAAAADQLLGIATLPSRGRDRDCWRQLDRRALVEELLARCEARMAADTEAAARAAQAAAAALGAVPRLAQSLGGSRAWNDLWGRTCALQGNLHRIRCEWAPAVRCFRQAFWHLEAGSGDAELPAHVLCFQASLLRDRGRHLEALGCLDQAERLFGELGDDHQQGRVLLIRADVLSLQGEVTSSIRVQIRALGLLDEDRDLVATLSAWTNLANCLRQAGRLDEADSVLASSEGFAEELPPESNARLTWRWSRGRLALARRDRKQAEDDLRHAFEGFRRQGNPFDCGQAGLDLLRLYAFEGRLKPMLELARTVVEALLSQDLAPQALEAVRLLGASVERRDVSGELLEQVADLLCRGERRRR